MVIQLKKVACLIGANEATIRKWINEAKIPIRNGGYYNKIYSQEFIDKVKSLYSEGYNTIEITEMLNLKRGIVSYLLREIGYELNHRGLKSKIKKEDYFDNIDSSDKAYFLGWLMADGNVSVYNGQYSIKVHIAYKDKELIDKFLKYIQSTNKAKMKCGKNPSYYVSLTSRHMCESLSNYGIVPQKTGFEIFPDNIPKVYIRDFIRGVFDGDGITDISRFRSGFVGSNNLVNRILVELNRCDLSIFNTKSKKYMLLLRWKKVFKRII